MSDDTKKGVPPVMQSKTIKRESLDAFTKADTGGDQYDRQRGNYGKNGTPKDTPLD